MRLVLMVLTVLAILARAFVPSGYMMQASAEGEIEIVICTDGGTSSIWLDAGGNPVEESGATESEAGNTCPYALGAVTVLGDTPPPTADFSRQVIHFRPTTDIERWLRKSEQPG